MKAVLELLLLPLRAPMLLVLLLVSLYMGLHWAELTQVVPGSSQVASQFGLVGQMFWPLQCLQAFLVVLVCTMPDLLLRELSQLMSASKALTLVVTLLAVITGGLYLLHLSVFTEILVLAAAVLLARLDLTRLRIVPPPLVMLVCLSLVVLCGIWLGHGLHSGVDHLMQGRLDHYLRSGGGE